MIFRKLGQLRFHKTLRAKSTIRWNSETHVTTWHTAPIEPQRRSEIFVARGRELHRSVQVGLGYPVRALRVARADRHSRFQLNGVSTVSYRRRYVFLSGVRSQIRPCCTRTDGQQITKSLPRYLYIGRQPPRHPRATTASFFFQNRVTHAR